MYTATASQYGASSSVNQRPLTQSAERVLAVIAEAGADGLGLSLSQLAQRAGIARRSAVNAISDLRTRALIEVAKGDCSGRPSRYRVIGFVQDKGPALVQPSAICTSAKVMQPSANLVQRGADPRGRVESNSAPARVVKTTSSSFHSEEVDVASLRSATSTATARKKKSAEEKSERSAQVDVDVEKLDAFGLSKKIQEILGIQPHSRWSQDWMMRGTSSVAGWLRGENAPTKSELLEATRREVAKLRADRGNSDVGTGWLRKALPGHIAAIRAEAAPLDIPEAAQKVGRHEERGIGEIDGWGQRAGGFAAEGRGWQTRAAKSGGGQPIGGFNRAALRNLAQYRADVDGGRGVVDVATRRQG